MSDSRWCEYADEHGGCVRRARRLINGKHVCAVHDPAHMEKRATRLAYIKEHGAQAAQEALRRGEIE